jgi:hypothetical protein
MIAKGTPKIESTVRTIKTFTASKQNLNLLITVFDCGK